LQISNSKTTSVFAPRTKPFALQAQLQARCHSNLRCFLRLLFDASLRPKNVKILFLAFCEAPKILLTTFVVNLEDLFSPGRSRFQSGKLTSRFTETFFVRPRFDCAGGHLLFEDGVKSKAV
jgi:hypothetical protein